MDWHSKTGLLLWSTTSCRLPSDALDPCYVPVTEISLPDMRFTWFRSSRLWRCEVGRVVPDVSKDCSAFSFSSHGVFFLDCLTFRSFETSGTINPSPRRHIPEDPNYKASTRTRNQNSGSINVRNIRIIMAVVVQKMSLWGVLTLTFWRNSFASTWASLLPWRWKQYIPPKRRNHAFNLYFQQHRRTLKKLNT
jgi:hypothetical protein